MSAQKTPLYDEHVRLGARVIDFAGWMMPVEYAGLRSEHMHVRSQCGIFDVSHMGEIRVKGANSLKTLQWLTTNDVAKLKAGEAQYSLLPNENGGLVDDIIVYCIEPGADYLVCVNAANTVKDWNWFCANNKGADLTNESEHWAQIAVQGPKAVEVVKDLFGKSVDGVAGFQFAKVQFEGANGFAARTGYTGEDGFEIFIPKEKAVTLWSRLLASTVCEVRPIGLGARDTLRTEMKYSLYGHEIDDATNPYAAGLGWVVKAEAKEFLGREVIVKNKALQKQKLVGFEMTDRGIARHGYKIVTAEFQAIGVVTSGTPSPSTDKNVGIGYVDAAYADLGSVICIDIRGKLIKAKVVKTPFVAKTSLSK